MENQLVTIRVFANLQEAEFAKALLESHEIPVFLGGNVALNQFRHVGDVHLQVPAHRVEESKALLSSEVTILHDPNLVDDGEGLEDFKARTKSRESRLLKGFIIVILLAGLFAYAMVAGR